MCETVSASEDGRGSDCSRRSKLGRRDLLRASVVGGGTVLLGTAAGATPAFAASSSLSSSAGAKAASTGSSDPGGLEVVLLGTGAGPGMSKRMGMSSALVVDGAVYLVDAGRGAASQFFAAGLNRGAAGDMFITHLHSDHMMSYYEFFLTATSQNLPGPMAVYGPGPAGALPPEVAGSTLGTVNPADPTPGLKRFTEDSNDAFAYSSNVLMRDTGNADPRDLMDVHEIALPRVGASALGDTAPRMRPFRVMEDSRVKVTAVLVAHGPVFPAFAFRFDTDHGSVTFSGDTRPTPNLVEIARNTDLLVLEAMGDAAMAGTDIKARHMRSSHIPLSEVGGIATEAGARRLVMSHIGTGSSAPIDDAQWTSTIRRSYDGPIAIGADLMRCEVTVGR